MPAVPSPVAVSWVTVTIQGTSQRGPSFALGMLKTDPWIHVRFYLVVTVEDE